MAFERSERWVLEQRGNLRELSEKLSSIEAKNFISRSEKQAAEGKLSSITAVKFLPKRINFQKEIQNENKLTTDQAQLED
jgi:hypothetical protein